MQSVSANSAGEAIQQMLVEKKISSKINYDVLRELSDETENSRGDTNTTPSVETTPPLQSSLLCKRKFSLLDSNSANTVTPSYTSYKSVSAPSRYHF